MSVYIPRDFLEEIESVLGQIVFSKSNSDSYCFSCQECGKKSLYLKTSSLIYNCFYCGNHGKVNSDYKIKSTTPVWNTKLQREILIYLCKNITLTEYHRLQFLKRRILRPENFYFKSIPFNTTQILTKKYTRDQLVDSGLLRDDGDGFKLIPQLSYNNVLIPFISEGKIIGFQAQLNNLDKNDSFRYLVFPSNKLGSSFYYPRINDDKYVILTESVYKAASAIDANYNAYGFIGIVPADEAIYKVNKLIKDNGIEKVFLIYDSSSSTESDLILAKTRLQKMLILKAEDITLPLLGKHKMDLDNYLFIKGNLKEVIGF